MIALATPSDPEVVDRRLPQVFALRLPVTRRYQQTVDADLLQSLWQGPGDITEPAGL